MIHNILKTISPSSSRGETSPSEQNASPSSATPLRDGSKARQTTERNTTGKPGSPGITGGNNGIYQQGRSNAAYPPQGGGVQGGVMSASCPSASFSIDDIVSEAYSGYPDSSRRPVIGITANVCGEDYAHRQAYFNQVTEAGGLPVMLCPMEDNPVDNVKHRGTLAGILHWA